MQWNKSHLQSRPLAVQNLYPSNSMILNEFCLSFIRHVIVFVDPFYVCIYVNLTIVSLISEEHENA